MKIRLEVKIDWRGNRPGVESEKSEIVRKKKMIFLIKCKLIPEVILRVSNSQFCVHILSWQMSVIILAVSTSDILRYLVLEISNISLFYPYQHSVVFLRQNTGTQQMSVWRNLVLTASCFMLQIQPLITSFPICHIFLNFQRQIFGILISSKYLCQLWDTQYTVITVKSVLKIKTRI